METLNHPAQSSRAELKKHLKALFFGGQNQIGRRLIFLVIAFSSLITLCTSVVQLFTEYRELRSTLDQQLDGVTIYMPGLAGSVWDFDTQQVQRALDALILLPSVARVSVVTSDTHTQWSAGEPDNVSTRTIRRIYPLNHEIRGAVHEIGKLTVVASLDGIYRQVGRSALSIVLSNGMKTFLVALFMVYLIRRLITDRLEKMARKVHLLVPKILPVMKLLNAERRPIPESLDELDAVDWTLDETAADLNIAVTALATLNEKLEQRVQERTKELESFSYSVSHDLRAPLRAIAGFSKIIADDYKDKLDDEGRRLLEIVRTNAIRMGQLIDDILEFSRMGSREMGASPIDMELMVREVFDDLLDSFTGRDVRLEIKTLSPAQGDKVMIRQVIVNLLANAIKFTRLKAGAVIEVSSVEHDGECIYCIKDNGDGFDMRYVHKLFNVFERLHDRKEFEGTGIGLAIVKRIIERHGGCVWAESKAGEGATFGFTLPRREQLI